MDGVGAVPMGRYRVTENGYAHRLVAWDFDHRPFNGAGDLTWFDGSGWKDFRFDTIATDMANHQAFCRGHMPAPVYADWLEEQGVPLPPDWYATLRGW